MLAIALTHSDQRVKKDILWDLLKQGHWRQRPNRAEENW
jgi:hypothetical protein